MILGIQQNVFLDYEKKNIDMVFAFLWLALWGFFPADQKAYLMT